MLKLYTFKCEKCDHTEEDLVAEDTKTIVCKKCGGDMPRVLVVHSFHLKGGGWYKDGYK